MNMKKQLTYLIPLLCLYGNAQVSGGSTGPNKPNLPEVIPPSPTVAALMKFEEVPVETYTGIPSIGFPFYNIPLDQNLSMDVSLSYHPSGVRLEETAGWAGTGWNLDAGGSISRTVYGLADEIGQYGIYANNFLQTQYPSDALRWETANYSKYDTESDLYQFNFMGHSGRFFISNDTAGVQVHYLNGDNTYKIIPTFDINKNITKFEVIDSKGYSYLFEVFENSTSYPFSTTTNFDGFQDYPIQPSTSYRSAWHLTKVNSPTGAELCTLAYGYSTERYATPRTFSRLVPISSLTGLPPWNEFHSPPYQYSSSQTVVESTTRKVNLITIPGKGEISFTTAGGRQDMLELLNGTPSGASLKEIQLKNFQNTVIKKFVLHHTYEGAGKRLFLNSIDELSADGNIILPTVFDYHNKQNLPNKDSYSKDHWGYYNAGSNTSLYGNIPELADYTGADRNTNTAAILTGVLKSITYPTGGIKEFDFESNEFSYIGNQTAIVEPTIFNTDPLSRTKTFVSSDLTPYLIIKIPYGQMATVGATATYRNQGTSTFFLNDVNGFRIKIQPVVLDDDFVPSLDEPHRPNIYDVHIDPDEIRHTDVIAMDACPGAAGQVTACTQQLSMAGYYLIKLEQANYLASFPVTYDFNIQYRGLKANHDPNTKGGGLRIKSVSFKDNGQVKKKTDYNYKFFNQPARSSGSLNVLPRYYEIVWKGALHETPGCNSPGQFFFLCFTAYDLSFYSQNDMGLNNIQKTKGADVGYKNVTISETGNGRTELTYTTPFDYPEPEYINYYPYKISKNYDHKRGLLLNKSIYDDSNQLLKKETNIYSITEQELHTGAKVYYAGGYFCAWNVLYTTHGNYQNMASQGIASCGTGSPGTLVSRNVQLCGWSKLMNTVTDEYFYGSTPAMTTSSTTRSYHSINKQLSSVTFTDNPETGGGPVFIGGPNSPRSYITQYLYPDNISSTALSGGNLTTAEFNAIAMLKANSLHRTSVPIQTTYLVDDEVTAIERNLYGNSWTGHSQYLPLSVSISKGTEPVEARVRYMNYDEKGNPLEVKMENGTSVCYIWGYSKTQAVAKIENIDYSSIPSNLITAIQNASNSDNPATAEAQLLTALDNLRNSPALANAMITTLTYKPLVGISTVTDQKRYRMTYNYDSFNRLQKVVDADGKILSENEYYYKNQN